jgi:hypothetical protein
MVAPCLKVFAVLSFIDKKKLRQLFSGNILFLSIPGANESTIVWHFWSKNLYSF